LFILKEKNLILNGSHPTILYGYGGFEVSLSPSYSASIGKVWLERGGVYVIANIRGGGEFGPEWHQAALKQNRQRAFDDFAAVAEDLIAQKITSPSHLGIKGGSNGGLLVGTVMVQRPELFNAALIQVPLLDMLRFSKLLAGASWIGEYGDPAISSECAYLLTYSPYHNVKPGKKYPHPFFTTSTKDDRVHPGHARKMAARMAEQGHSFYYHENINGGHAGTANLEELARIAGGGNEYRKIIVHYTVYSYDAKEINSGIAEQDFPSDINNPSKIIDKYFSKVAETINSRVIKALTAGK
jgi:prolyl oligopeptidase